MSERPEGRATTVVEVCVGGPDGAVAAATAGADRIELNSALALGGLTPSPGAIRSAVAAVDVPVIVMVRPRESGFCYSDREFDAMRHDLDMIRDTGAAGVAFGFVTAVGRVDVARCRSFVEQLAGMESVFHRAFDVVGDPFAALDALIELGVTRVMTSGQATSASAGAERIADLVRHAADRIEILAAGGIRAHNVNELISQTGCDQVHAALQTTQRDPSMDQAVGVAFSSDRADSESFFSTTDTDQVRALVDAVREN